MVTKDSTTTPGFTLYRGIYARWLLPIATAAEIEAERNAQAEAEDAAQFAADVAAAAEKDAAAAQKAKSNPVIPPKKVIPEPGPRDVEIFSESVMESLRADADSMESSSMRAGERVYSSLMNDRGRYRTIPVINPRDILSLASQFENMAEPIKRLAGELELMAHLPPEDFHITPMLFLGEPGIGKTAFANALSKAFGVPYSKLKGSEPSFCLTGSHSSWNRAAPGVLVNQLASHDSAAPLFLVDELDKQGGEQYPITNALLDLLEPENARHFKDEFFQFPFDVSHAIWILTANTVEGVADPLLSRMNVFDIPMPGIEQRKRIIEADFKKLRNRTGVKIRTNPNDVMILAERVDLDLRKVTRIVRDSFIAALGHGKFMARFDFPPSTKPSMGFI
ncbi:MAG: AAA family ATPase [Sulfuricella sp.]